MKSKFHPRRFLQITLCFAALTFTQCKKPGAPGVISGEGASSSFSAVASRLELGGSSFNYSEAGGAKALAAFIDEIIKALPERERRDIPPGFTVTRLFQMLGLDCVAAYGSSTRARADGSFHSRSFAFTPSGRKGLLALSGGKAEKLMLLGTAPKDTDLALEFPISTKDFARESLSGFLEMLPPAERSGVEMEMSQPLPPLGLSGKQILEKLDARVGIYLRLDPSQKFQPAPDAPQLPGVDAVIVIERLGWLVDALKPQLMQALKEPGAPVSVTDEGGVLTIRMTAPAGPPPMDFQPVVRFDSKADRILIATRPALFDSIAGGKEKITDGVDFTQAWRDLPSEGNACIYASSRLLQTFGSLVHAAAMREGGSSDEAAILQKISDWVKPLISRRQAMVIANQGDGVLVLTNASVSMGSSTMAGVSAVAVMAGFAMPVFTSAQAKARQTNDMSNLKQVNLALRLYAGDNDGKYPAALSDLAPRYTGTNSILEFTDSRTKRRIPWMYRSSLTETSPGDEVLVAAPLPGPDGTRVVGFNDGSVRSIPDAEFQKLWNKQ